MIIVSIIIIQVVIFIGLILILQRIITKNVVSATKHLEELDREYAKKEAEVDRRLDEVKQESEKLITQAEKQAEELKTKILQETEGEKDKILKQARVQSNEVIEQADKSRQLLLAEINERITKEAGEKACELIQVALPEQFKKDAHAQWVEDLIENGLSQLDRLRIGKDINEAKITSALALDGKQRKSISGKLKSVLGRDIIIKEEIDAKVVAGLVITIGSLVLDGSLRNRIKEKAKGA